MTKRYRSDALAALHESLEALHDIGAIDKRTLREFDEACLSPVLPMTLERALHFVREDEMVEVTPVSIRLRKAVLSAKDRHTLDGAKKKDKG